MNNPDGVEIMTTSDGQSPSILIVDDNSQNLATLTQILTDQGYSVHPAINGEVALTVAQTLVPDVILLDIRMPGLDGYEVCRQLKATESTCEIPVLFLSALDDITDKVKAFNVGGVDYITKPFQADEVVARVETHIVLRTMQKQLQEQNRELGNYREHLEDLVEARTSELRQVNTLLHQEMVKHRETARSLRVSEQQYRSLAESVTDGIVIVQEGQIVFTNAAFTALFGYSPADLLQKEFASLFPEKEKTTLHSRLTQEFPVHPWQAEIVTRDGRTRWIEASQTAMVWEDQPALLLTITDITDRKLRELHLEEEQARLRQENLTLKSTMIERYRFGELVGKSPAMQRVYELITSAATSEVNVLVSGESGTGKELIARTIHQLSARRERVFVSVNCASIPEALFEREFFGHRKGAFTGADRDKPGLFDRAHQGTLFLDEVTELNPGTQAKLLRVLQDGEYIPLGSTTAKIADALIVAATNKDPRTLIEQGKLREDFFYRICVIELRMPPLRERKEDLPLLIEHVLHQYRQKQTERQGIIPANLPANPTELPGELIQALFVYHWPGNVRELQNVLHRYLATKDLNSVLSLLAAPTRIRAAVTNIEISSQETTLPEAVQTLEQQMISNMLAHNHYRIGKTAEKLGISVRSLQYKIKKYQLMSKD
jgi:PAS domain S-box-containing protein